MENGKCFSCVEETGNCATCSSRTECHSCIVDYYIDRVTCKACDTNCEKGQCDGTTGECKDCLLAFYHD